MTRMVFDGQQASGLERQVNHGRNPSPQWQSSRQTCDKKIVRRWQKGNCALCFIASHSTSLLVWSLIWSCGRFLLVLCPLFAALFLIALLWAFFDLTTLCPICLISGSVVHICQGTSILLGLVLFSFHLTSCSSKPLCMLKEKYNGQQGGKRWWLEDN